MLQLCRCVLTVSKRQRPFHPCPAFFLRGFSACISGAVGTFSDDKCGSHTKIPATGTAGIFSNDSRGPPTDMPLAPISDHGVDCCMALELYLASVEGRSAVHMFDKSKLGRSLSANFGSIPAWEQKTPNSNVLSTLHRDHFNTSIMISLY